MRPGPLFGPAPRSAQGRGGWRRSAGGLDAESSEGSRDRFEPRLLSSHICRLSVSHRHRHEGRLSHRDSRRPTPSSFRALRSLRSDSPCSLWRSCGCRLRRLSSGRFKRRRNRNLRLGDADANADSAALSLQLSSSSALLHFLHSLSLCLFVEAEAHRPERRAQLAECIERGRRSLSTESGARLSAEAAASPPLPVARPDPAPVT